MFMILLKHLLYKTLYFLNDSFTWKLERKSPGRARLSSALDSSLSMMNGAGGRCLVKRDS